MRWQADTKRITHARLERELVARIGVSGDDNDDLIELLIRELVDARAVVECAAGMMKMPNDPVMRAACYQSLKDYYGEKYIP